MYLFDKTGKMTEFTEENAREVLAGGEYSALFPKGTADAEEKEFEHLCKDVNHPGDGIARQNRPLDADIHPASDADVYAAQAKAREETAATVRANERTSYTRPVSSES